MKKSEIKFKSKIFKTKSSLGRFSRNPLILLIHELIINFILILSFSVNSAMWNALNVFVLLWLWNSPSHNKGQSFLQVSSFFLLLLWWWSCQIRNKHCATAQQDNNTAAQLYIVQKCRTTVYWMSMKYQCYFMSCVFCK